MRTRVHAAENRQEVYREMCYQLNIVIMLSYLAVTAPRCYVCNSLSEPACGHAFMLQKTDKKYIERCATSCYRFMAQKDDNAGKEHARAHVLPDHAQKSLRCNI